MSTGILYIYSEFCMTEIELCCRLRSLRKAIEKREGETIEKRRKRQLSKKEESFHTKRLGKLSYPLLLVDYIIHLCCEFMPISKLLCHFCT